MLAASEPSASTMTVGVGALTASTTLTTTPAPTSAVMATMRPTGRAGPGRGGPAATSVSLPVRRCQSNPVSVIGSSPRRTGGVVAGLAGGPGAPDRGRERFGGPFGGWRGRGGGSPAVDPSNGRRADVRRHREHDGVGGRRGAGYRSVLGARSPAAWRPLIGRGASASSPSWPRQRTARGGQRWPRPSLSLATAASMRRWRVSGVLASSMPSTNQRCWL